LRMINVLKQRAFGSTGIPASARLPAQRQRLNNGLVVIA
jgi:hypothetical protein